MAITWRTISSHPDYVNASDEQKVKLKNAFYNNVIKKDPNYKPEYDEQIRTSLFGEQAQALSTQSEVTPQQPVELTPPKPSPLVPLMAGSTSLSASGIGSKRPVAEAMQANPILQGYSFAQTQMDRPSAAIRSKMAGQSALKGFLHPEQAPDWGMVLKPKLSFIKNEVTKDITARTLGFVADTLLYTTMSATLPPVARTMRNVYTGKQGAALNELKTFTVDELVKRGVSSEVAQKATDIHIAKNWKNVGFVRRFPSAFRESIKSLKDYPEFLDTVAEGLKSKTTGTPPPEPTVVPPEGLPYKTFIGGYTGRKGKIQTRFPKKKEQLVPSVPVENQLTSAVKTTDGKVYTAKPGSTHGGIIENNPDVDFDKIEFEFGFVDSSGKFLTRKELVDYDATMGGGRIHELTPQEHKQQAIKITPELRKKVLGQGQPIGGGKPFVVKSSTYDPLLPTVKKLKGSKAKREQKLIDYTTPTRNPNDPTTIRDTNVTPLPVANGENPFKLSFIEQLQDTTYTMQNLQRRTGIPFYDRFYVNLRRMHNEAMYKVDKISNKIVGSAREGSLTKDSDTNIINAIVQDKTGQLTTNEKLVYHEIKKAFKQTEPIIKFLKLKGMMDGSLPTPNPIKPIVDQATDVYKRGGDIELFKFARKQKFGIIEEGYFPASIKRALLFKQALKTSIDPENPHVLSRTADDQIYESDVGLLIRIQTYLKRVYSDFYMYNELKDLANVLESNKPIPSETISMFTEWSRALRGFGVPTKTVGKLLRKARGQFMSVVYLNPLTALRNLAQITVSVPGMMPAPSFAYKLAHPYKLKPIDEKYIRKHAYQKADLQRSHMALYEVEKGKKLPINRMAEELSGFMISRTDELVRLGTYRIIMSGLEEDLIKYKNGEMTFEEVETKHGLFNLTPMERRHALTLSPDKAARYMAKEIVDKTSGRYKLMDKGALANSESLAENAMFLYTYPKFVETYLINSFNQIKNGKSYAERMSGVNAIVTMYVMGLLVDYIMQKVFGKTEYYDERSGIKKRVTAYNIKDTIFGITLFGAQRRQWELAENIIAGVGDLMSPKVLGNKKKLSAVLVSITRSADMLSEQYIPFLKYVDNAAESVLGVQQFRVLTTIINKILRKKSRVAGAKAHRTLLEKLSHFAFGTER